MTILLPGLGATIVAAAPSGFIYVDNQVTDTVASGVADNFDNVPLGLEGATRVVHVNVSYYCPSSSSATPTCTANGTAMTLIGFGNAGTARRYQAQFIAVVPTGSEVDIAFTVTPGREEEVIVVGYSYPDFPIPYSLDDSGSTGGSGSCNVNVLNRSLIWFASTDVTTGSSPTMSWSYTGTGVLTEEVDFSVNIGAGNVAASMGWIEATADHVGSVDFTGDVNQRAYASCYTLDPFSDWEKVSLQLSFDGSDGATSTTDDSRWNGTISFFGNAQLDTAQSKFGGSSLLLDGTGDYVSLATSPRFWFSMAGYNSPFTIEGFFRWNADPSSFQHLVGLWSVTGDEKSWDLRYDGAGNELEFAMSVDGSTTLTDIAFSWTPTLNTWYHIAVDFDGSKYRLYLDGTMVGSSTTIRSLYPSKSVVALGARGSDATEYFNGWVEEVRVVRGAAIYATDSGFTPPTEAFPNDGF